MALSAAVQELMYLRQLLSDLGFPQKHASTLYEDNQGAMALANGCAGMVKRTKHIDIRELRELALSAVKLHLSRPAKRQCRR